MASSRPQSEQTRMRVRLTWLIGVAALCLMPTAVRAQCVGDCDGDGKVVIGELIIGVNIVLGSQDPSTCKAFQDPSGDVNISQLLKGVNSLLVGCPIVATPTVITAVQTPTPTKTTGPIGTATATNTEGPSETPTLTFTPVPTTTPGGPAVCGDGVIEAPETCDDGDKNGTPGDNCPSTCAIATCQSTMPPVIFNVDVLIEAPAGTIGALNVFLSYPDAEIFLPGSGADASHVITNLPDDAFSPVENDVNWGVSVVAVGPGGLTLGDNNRFFTAQFTRCKEAGVPTAGDFACVVEDAELLDLDTGNQTNVTSQSHCSIALQ